MRATNKDHSRDKDLDANDSHAEDKSDDTVARARPPAHIEAALRVGTAVRQVLAPSPRFPEPAGVTRAQHQALVDLFVANRGVDEGARDLSGGAQKKRLNRALETLAPTLAELQSPEVPGGRALYRELQGLVSRLRAHIDDRIAVEGVVFSAPKSAKQKDDNEEPADNDGADKAEAAVEGETARR